MKLYNTLTKRTETFEPGDGKTVPRDSELFTFCNALEQLR